jgi:hypothetical protein
VVEELQPVDAPCFIPAMEHLGYVIGCSKDVVGEGAVDP